MDYLKEYGMDIAQEKIAKEVSKLSIEYENTHEQKIKDELAQMYEAEEIKRGLKSTAPDMDGERDD